jgi:hypothetical protein
MINCINYSHPKVKALVDAVGKDKTMEIFIENDFSIPEDITPYLDNIEKLPENVVNSVLKVTDALEKIYNVKS